MFRFLFVGYNDVLLIPAGATNIRVEETGPSNNYLGNSSFFNTTHNQRSSFYFRHY